MKIAFMFAHSSYGCAPNYTIDALRRMGHVVDVHISRVAYNGFDNSYDLYFAQDSGEGIDFRVATKEQLRKTAAWFWDSRFNRIQRNPGDDDMAKLVADNGGWVFQAQTPDVERVKQITGRVSWLPIAGDPVRWQNVPIEDKIYNLSFVGNCYDPGRGDALNRAREKGLKWDGPNSSFFEDAAKVYRQSKVVFHAPTFYNLPHDVTHERIDYDVTMRYYEAFLCGVPVVTPPMPDFKALGFIDSGGLFLYGSPSQIPFSIDWALDAVSRGEVDGTRLRKFILENHTYEKRMQQAFTKLQYEGVITSYVG